MSLTISIVENKEFFLHNTSFFERRRILQLYFEQDLKPTEEEKDILKQCLAIELETIALIGFFLVDDTPINTFRLRLGSTFRSDLKLAQACDKLFDNEDIEKAETILFHYDYAYSPIEENVIDLYVQKFK